MRLTNAAMRTWHAQCSGDGDPGRGCWLLQEAVGLAFKGQDGFSKPQVYAGLASLDTLLGSVCLCASEGRNLSRNL